MKKVIPLFLLFVAVAADAMCQIAIGAWRDHFSYNKSIKVCCADKRVYVAANMGLYYYDTDDNTINRLNKMRGCSDVGISTIAYDPASRYLVVAYKNSNIDIIDKNDKVRNLNDIKRNDIGGDKTVNSITFRNRCAYLSCAFGVVVIDMDRCEIKETYYLGPDGTYLNINDVAFTDSLIVAATDDGIMSARIDNPHLNIVYNWTLDENSLLAGQKVRMLGLAPDGKLLALAESATDTAVYRETAPISFVPWVAGDIRFIRVSHGKTLVAEKQNLSIYGADYQLEHSLGSFGWIDMKANDAELSADGMLRVAHDWYSLVSCNPSSPDGTESYLLPDGPESDNVFSLTSWNDEMMACPGGHTTTYSGVYLPAGMEIFSNEDWHRLQDPQGFLQGKLDLLRVTVNPRNSRRKAAVVWNYGIAEIEDNKVVAFYDQDNSDGALVQYSQGGYTALMTSGVAYDRQANLWITVTLQPNGLAVRRSNGTWQNFNTQDMVGGYFLDNIICDSINNIKVFWGTANRIFLHDGDSKSAYIDPNNGARLQTSAVNCVVQDHSGNLWVGTNKGVKVVYDLSRAFQNGGNGEKSPVTCSNILYNENGINEYLLAYENITCIAVDGANRKWIGTATGGLYLLSANGLEQIEHFTSSNSSLLSDKVIALSVMPWSGELFIGTDRGLQSYRSTATYATAEPQDEVYAFPNPVREDYDGPIAIKGFTRNGLVHITDAAGHTVYSTRANGGQAIWYGRTNSGKKVASGVYYVFASAENGDMRSVGKVLIIR